MKTLETLLSTYVEKTKEILKDRLTGIYLHGSAAMGCFNPGKSDVDLIIVVDGAISDGVKRAYMDVVTALNSEGPAKGIEMSVVRRSVCAPFVYPTPFELHFSIAHLRWYEEDPEGYVREMNGTDPDLAAHFTVIKNRGRCLYGAPIEEVFAEVPACDYMDAILKDVEGAEAEIADDPLYLILNLARVLAYREAGLVLSKKEGGAWALQNLPEEYHPLIRDALREYEDSAEVVYDAGSARQYAKEMLTRIRSAKGGRKMLENIEVFTQSSIRIRAGIGNVYIDPFQLKETSKDADFILITHDHYDHFSPDDIRKAAGTGCLLIVPEKMREKARVLEGCVRGIETVLPGASYEFGGLKFETVAAYNLLKPFHPKSAGWVGYVLETDGLRIYIAGDTDATKEAKTVRCDVALVPIGGTYTMNAGKAAALVNEIRPETAIPTHYGGIVGKEEDAEAFAAFVKAPIRVEIKKQY